MEGSAIFHSIDGPNLRLVVVYSPLPRVKVYFIFEILKAKEIKLLNITSALHNSYPLVSEKKTLQMMKRGGY